MKPQHSPGGNKSMPHEENRCIEQFYLRPAALHFHSSDYIRAQNRKKV